MRHSEPNALNAPNLGRESFVAADLLRSLKLGKIFGSLEHISPSCPTDLAARLAMQPEKMQHRIQRFIELTHAFQHSRKAKEVNSNSLPATHHFQIDCRDIKNSAIQVPFSILESYPWRQFRKVLDSDHFFDSLNSTLHARELFKSSRLVVKFGVLTFACFSEEHKSPRPLIRLSRAIGDLNDMLMVGNLAGVVEQRAVLKDALDQYLSCNLDSFFALDAAPGIRKFIRKQCDLMMDVTPEMSAPEMHLLRHALVHLTHTYRLLYSRYPHRYADAWHAAHSLFPRAHCLGQLHDEVHKQICGNSRQYRTYTVNLPKDLVVYCQRMGAVIKNILD